jgi:hypothetical protein
VDDGAEELGVELEGDETEMENEAFLAAPGKSGLG